MSGNNNQVRVLVSTVGAWSESSGSNTMSELFRDYDKDKLACLYIRANISDSSSCHCYFHIYEGKVMRSIFRRGIATGEDYRLGEVTDDSAEERIERERYNKYRNKSNWLYLFAREFVWLFGKWKSRELNKFLDDFHPEALVFPIESYIHFNRINEYIINRCKPKTVIGYLWDDNFTYKQYPRSIGYRLHRWWLRNSVKRLVGRCSTVFSICPKMKREADVEFGIKSVLLSKPIYEFSELKTYTEHSPIRILYTGKLIYGRDETIAEIVDSIREVNRNEQKVILQLYTNTELPHHLKERICVKGCCELKGFVPQAEVLKLQREADVLLYAESLSDEYLPARLSFSTKMTDYLSSGVCIWAVGNNDLASIEYLKEQNAGIVSTDHKSIVGALQDMVQKPFLLAEYALKARECGKRNHNHEDLTKIFDTALCRFY